MERYNSTLLDEVATLIKAAPAKRSWLTLPDLIQLGQRGIVALPVDVTHLGCLWVLDRWAPCPLPPHRSQSCCRHPTVFPT